MGRIPPPPPRGDYIPIRSPEEVSLSALIRALLNAFQMSKGNAHCFELYQPVYQILLHADEWRSIPNTIRQHVRVCYDGYEQDRLVEGFIFGIPLVTHNDHTTCRCMLHLKG